VQQAANAMLELLWELEEVPYGLLTYHNTENLGDEIQSIAVRRFLPTIDAEIDRDRLASFQPDDGRRYKVVCNGWFSHCPAEWPPSQAIEPLLISIHISRSRSTQGILPADIMLHDGVIEYLRHFGPVGARDLATLELLEKAGVAAYFSGCVTLTLPKRNVAKRDDLIVVCDIPDEAFKYIRSKTAKSVQSVSVVGRSFSSKERFAEAAERLSLLESASCVVTSRLHTTLPCLALGVPVFMIDIAEDQYRFSGLSTLYRHGRLDAFLLGTMFDIENPTPNSNDYNPLARNIEQMIKSFISNHEGVRSHPDLMAARINAITVGLMREARRNWEQEGIIRMLQAKLNDAPADDSEWDVEEFARLRERVMQLEADIAHKTGELADAAQLRERVDELETEIARNSEELAQIRLIHGGLWTAQKQATEEVNSLKAEVSRRDSEIEVLRRELELLGNANGEATEELKSLRAKVSRHKRRMRRLTAPLRFVKATILRLKN
jgi:hypothetical protein